MAEGGRDTKVALIHGRKMGENLVVGGCGAAKRGG